MDARPAAGVEASAIIRRVTAEGGFAAVLEKGDPDRGSILLLVRSRGRLVGLLEREMGPDFRYGWVLTSASDQFNDEKLDELMVKKRRFDADYWLIELDIADPERFIAETIQSA